MSEHDQVGIVSCSDSTKWDERQDCAGTAALAAPLAGALTVEAQPRRAARKVLGTRPERNRLRSETAEESVQTHAIIVAGDHGWGGGPLDDIPCRPLMELAGRPLIAHTLDWLRGQSIQSASICANSNTTQVRQYLRDGRDVGMSLQYYCDVMPRGPAGCVCDAAADWEADTFVVVSGMVVPRIDIAEALRQHRQTEACVTVVSCPAGANGLEPSGLYLFSPNALERISATGYQDIKETLLPQLRRIGRRIGLFAAAGQDVLRVTDLESYMHAARRMIEESLDGDSMCEPEYVRMGDAWVHRACVIHPRVQVIGPAIIGPGCTIEADVLVVGPTSIGQGCHIERGAVLSRSSIWGFCRIGGGAVVDNCLLSQGSVVRPMHDLRDALWTH